MAKSEKEIEELEEKNEQDGRWLFNKLQEVADLAETKKINTYVTSITFLSFANHLNKNLAPDSQMAVAVSLRVIMDQLKDEHQANYLRNPRSGWNVYVPVGSLARGEELVTTGAGKTIQCAICHGVDLMGLANVPGIGGRSPSYMMRQLYDMKVGARNGVGAALMMPVIANLTVDDMTDIVAYLASVEPPTPAPTDPQ